MSDFPMSLKNLSDVSVLDAPADKAPHLVDWRKRHFGKAFAVAFPKTTLAVAEIVRLCAA